MNNLLARTVVGGMLLGMAACSSGAKVEPKVDYQRLLDAATVTLSASIDKALAVKEAKGCVVVNAEIEEENGRIIHSMELANGNKILEINFDARDGSLLPLETEDHDKSSQAKAAKITLKEALEIATRAVEGTAVEGSLLLKEGKPVCDVKVFTPKGKVHTVSVNAETGAVLIIVKESKKDKTKEAGKEEKEGEKK